MIEYKYMILEEITKYIPEMKRLGIEMVARSPNGFLRAYKKAKGKPNRLSQSWHTRRYEFIKQHLAQYKVNPTAKKKLALIAWGYMP